MPVPQYLQLLQLAGNTKEAPVTPPAAAAAAAAVAGAAAAPTDSDPSKEGKATRESADADGQAAAAAAAGAATAAASAATVAAAAGTGATAAAARGSLVLLGGIVSYCQEATDAVGCLLGECEAFDRRLRGLLRQQKKVQRQHAVHRKLETTWQGDTAAAAAAGEEVGMLHELRCCSSASSSSSSSSSRCRVLRMQGLVGQELAADCETILPKAREALQRWRLRQQQQQQQQQQPGQQQQEQDAHSGEEQFYAQSLGFGVCLLLESADIPSGFSLWRCMGLSGHGVLWQLLHEETVDLSLIKLQSLSLTAVAAIAAAAEPHQQQEQQQQQQQKQQLLTAGPAAAVAAAAAGVSLEELLRSGASYNSPGGLQRAQQLAIELAAAVVSLGSIRFLLPLKLSRVFVSGHRIVLAAGLPLSLLLLPAAAAAAPAAAAEAHAAVAAPAAAAAGAAADDDTPKPSAATKSSAVSTGLATAVAPREKPARPSSGAAAAAAAVDSSKLSWSLVSSLREATAATELWAEDLCCCLPPECTDTSMDLCRCPEAVDKAHAWMLGLLLLRICLGSERAGKQRMWGQEPQEQIEAAIQKVDATEAQEFLRVCLQREPAKRPPLSALVRSHSYLQQQPTTGAAAAGAQIPGSSEVASPFKPRRSRRPLQAAATATSISAEADSSAAAAAAAAAASPPSTAAEFSVSQSVGKKRRLGPQLGEASMSSVRAPKKSAAGAAAVAAAGGRVAKPSPSLLPPLVGSRLQQQLQQHPAAATAAATRLLDCCDALFGDVGRLVPALIKEGKRRRQRGEEGVAFYRQNDPLALDSMPPQSLPQSQTGSPTAAAAAAAAASAGATAAAAAAALQQQQTTRPDTS
ncbi:hypothetical protein Emag_000395 [Eimeria magna]